MIQNNSDNYLQGDEILTLFMPVFEWTTEQYLFLHSG